jgi:hypothetical protein
MVTIVPPQQSKFAQVKNFVNSLLWKKAAEPEPTPTSHQSQAAIPPSQSQRDKAIKFIDSFLRQQAAEPPPKIVLPKKIPNSILKKESKITQKEKVKRKVKLMDQVEKFKKFFRLSIEEQGENMEKLLTLLESNDLDVYDIASVLDVYEDASVLDDYEANIHDLVKKILINKIAEAKGDEKKRSNYY